MKIKISLCLYLMGFASMAQENFEGIIKFKIHITVDDLFNSDLKHNPHSA